MGDPAFSLLDPVTFLQTIMTQCVRAGEECGCGSSAYLMQIGLSAGSCFEAAYREEFGLERPLTLEEYTDLIIAIKNKIGGAFSRSSSGPGYVRVVNTRCPFGESIRQAPELCAITSSVFGGIAAKNFGYAKVTLNKSIGAREEVCDVCVTIDRQAAESLVGEEYHFERGLTVNKKNSASLNARIHEQMRRVWTQSASNGGRKPERLAYIVAQSEAMRRALEIIETTAPTKATILITGETGVGKELIARAVHAMSGRWNKNFMAVNCGAIPENLIESALFGHERGAFTNAYEVRQGFFERAQGGTLFLDEIDSLPLHAQVRLLRVLQEEEFERVGGKQTLMADVRVIAAGSERLRRQVEQGTFRRDLYYRLNVVPIHIPPLAERPEDIPQLAEHILGKLAKRHQKGEKILAPAARAALSLRPWPGNVREMENVLEHAYLFAKGPVIEELAFPDFAEGTRESAVDLRRIDLKKAKKQAADKVETMVLDEALRQLQGNVKAVAKLLNITPRAVHQKLSQRRMEAGHYRGRPPTP